MGTGPEQDRPATPPSGAPAPPAHAQGGPPRRSQQPPPPEHAAIAEPNPTNVVAAPAAPAEQAQRRQGAQHTGSAPVPGAPPRPAAGVPRTPPPGAGPPPVFGHPAPGKRSGQWNLPPDRPSNAAPFAWPTGMESAGTSSIGGHLPQRGSQEEGSGPAGDSGRESDSGRGSDGSSGRGTGPGTGRGRRSQRGSQPRSSSRMRLGAGLVEVPRVPYRDPASAVMTTPVVAESKRYCGNCSKPVGRGSNGRPGEPDGVCQDCGSNFSFRPKLRSGDMLAGQYEVLGAVAYGGVGWIYLAKDHNVSERWVVLKGLIDTGDAAAMQAAVAEQQFLAEVEHPNIVKIYNFVQDPDPRSGSQVGYIVMEYVGGQSLRQLALSHLDQAGKVVPLPLAQVIAYGLEVLPALGYLHGAGLLYCDLKPDNVIQTHEQLKLIDLGAVRRMDDMESPIFFTAGYSAPELASDGPSVASDLYTVGRMLAVLSFDFTGYTNSYAHSLPTPRDVPLFALFDSYYRLLRRATHADPDRRFPSAEEMADQLTGVLREVIALSTREPRPGRSTVFGPELRTFGSEVVTVREDRSAAPTPPEWTEVTGALPVPQADPTDPAAGLLGTTSAPGELLDALQSSQFVTPEARFGQVRARIELGQLNAASHDLDDAAAMVADAEGIPADADWRVNWYRGLLALAGRRPRDARPAFEAVYDLVPGELAPKLALAISAEYCGDFFAAARFYELVWRTDRNYVSAAFGLARVYLAQNDRSGALEVLESVPDRSSHYVQAQTAAITVRTRIFAPEQLSEADLVHAANRLERLRLDPERWGQLSLEVLRAAYDWVQAGKPGGDGSGRRVLGCELNDRDLRFGLERGYRSLARLASSTSDRVLLVDRANAVRPRTLT
jgi:serine/threonine-protein kinase PknG